MKNKILLRFLVFIFLALISYTGNAQTTITIGTGTSSGHTYGPIYRSSAGSGYDYSRYGYLYTNSELNIPTGAEIQKIEWFKNSIDTLVTSDYAYMDIWMANTSATTSSSTAWTAVTAASTRVFRDSFNVTDNVQSTVGWYEFSLTPFTYTGQSLQIVADWDVSAPSSTTPTSGSFSWLYGTAPATRAFYANNSSQPTTLSSTSSSRPNIRITYTYTAPTDDAGISAITSPVEVPCVGSQAVVVNLLNGGSDSLKSATINWTVNGASQTPFIWSDTLLTGQTASVSLGSISVTSGSSQLVKIWSSSPNGVADGAVFNDTMEITVVAGKSGEYTIGGTGTPDYATLSDAIADFDTTGLCGSVRLLVHEGTYSEQVVFGDISGLSASNTLKVVSHPSNTQLPVFNFAATGTSSNYVFQFNNSSFITVDSLELNATGSSYSRVVVLSNDNNDITISNSVLRGKYVDNSTSTNYAVLFCNTTSSLDENITIENNTILNGSIGIYIYGGSSALEGGNSITNNTIDSFYNYGIQSYYQQEIEITGNFIKDNDEYTSPRGIFANNNNSLLVDANTVLIGGSSSPFGMYLDYNDGTASKPTVIKNNMVSMYSASASGTVYGIEIYAAENNHVANNSISLYGGSTSSRALYLYASLAGDSIRAYNNALAHYGVGYALYATTATSGIVDCDYNSLYAEGTNIAYWGSAQATLADLQAASGFDANSIVANPLFADIDDLHSTSAAINNSGKVLAYVTEDIDGDARSVTNPDIGADEFTPPPVDAGIVSLEGGTYCAGVNSLEVELFNFATDTLKSVMIIREVAVNAGAYVVLDTTNWTGALLSGQGIAVNTGNFTIAIDKYNFRFYTSNPNGFVDPNTSNDTLITDTIRAALSGTYTVGGTTPDYATFADVGADLIIKGMCSSVTLEVRQGIYNEQVFVSAIKGLSSSNTLSVVSAPGNTSMPVLTYAASGSLDNYVLAFENASYVSIDGIEIRATGSNYATAVEFSQDNSHVSLTNNRIIGKASPSTTSTNIATVYFNTGGVNDHLIFDNNEIFNGSYGIYGNANSSNRGLLNEFTNNTIDSFYYRGLYSYYQDSSVITGNFVRDNNNYTSPSGLYIVYNSPTYIADNEVYVGGSSAPFGMYLDYNDGSVSNPVYIVNNMVSMYNENATGTVTGIEVYNAENNIVANNSIAVYGGSSTGRALYLYASGSSDNLSAFNNVAANYGGGYALSGGNVSSIDSSDYNSLYTTGSNIATWSFTAQATLADLRTASGFEASTVEANPVFISVFDLHAKGTGINNLGAPLAFVTNDIDGDARSGSNPDIGADEFTPPVNDLAIVEILNDVEKCAVSDQEMKVVVTNFGTASQSGYTVSLEISGAVTQTLSASSSSSLATSDLDTISLGTFNSLVGGTFNFKAYTSLIGDEDLLNDTVTLNGIEVNALPSAPTVADQTVCIADASAVSLSASGGATSYTWYDSDMSTTIGTGSSYVVSVSETDTFFVQGNYSAAFGVGALNNSIGAGGNYATVSEGLVFDVNNDITLDSVTVYPNGAGDVVVVIKDASGTTVSTTTVAVTGSGAQRLFVGASLSAGAGYKISAVGTTTGGLYRNSAGASMPYTDADNNVSIINTINNLSGFYYFFYDWAITAGGCSSPLAQVIVNVIETASPIVTNDTICEGEDAQFYITSFGNDITWYASATSTTPIARGYSYIANSLDTTTSFFVKDLGANGCESELFEVKAVVNQLPEAPVVSDTTICANEMVMLISNASSGTTNWFNTTTGGTPIHTGDTLMTGALTSTSIFYVSEEVKGCEGDRADVIVTVNAKPNDPIVNGVSALCQGESATLAATIGTNVMWYNANQSILLGTGSTFETGALSATGTFFAVSSLNGCTSDAVQVVVIVNDKPAAPIVAAATICEANTATLNAGFGATKKWYNTSDVEVFTGDVFTTPVLSETTSYYVIASSSTCVSDRTNVTVTVTPNVDADVAIEVCEGTDVELVLANESYNWYANAEDVTPLATSSSYELGAVVKTDTFYAQAVGGNCTDAKTQIIVTVKEQVTLTDIAGATICEGETATVSATSNGTVNWYTSATSSTPVATGASYITPVLVSTEGYFVQADNGTCMSDRAIVIVNVNAAPSADFIAEDHGSRIVANATETNAGYIHNWTIGSKNISNGGSSILEDSVAQGTVTITHTIVNSITGCTSSATQDVTIGTASVNEFDLGSISLYPNPNSGQFTIDLPKQDSKYSVVITNVTGQVVYTNNTFTSRNNTVQLDVPVGMYFVKITDANNAGVIKVLVK
ncbi:MAG: hypothetical protein COA58_09450 [Bacteroidetes bacterium]|nr:MAG: hypothetical protein COA58_09450 [Bacteroidota bacterium]